MVETIETERLILRPLRPSDAGPIAMHCSDERVARMTASIPHPFPPGAADAFIEGSLSGRRAEDAWAIDATPVGGEELIGVIGYKPEPRELGYWVGPPSWNVGYATEAVRALVAHLFRHRRLDWIVANVFVDNPASAAVLMKAGLREVGRSAGFSLTRSETVQNRVFRIEAAEFARSLEAGQPTG